MITKSDDKQFKLADDGQILWQQDPTNPLPGIPIGHIAKGESLLKPKALLLESLPLSEEDRGVIAEKLQQWMDLHLHLNLEPLFRLVGGDDLTGAAKDFAARLQASLGIMPRDALEDLIPSLGEEGRKLLRDRKVRLGPVLVFMPELNKPAAVRLRAILLTLWADKTLPAEAPKDGMVSLSVVDKNVDADYYRSIGYPVFGPRAIRVDMLDRVICSVYDGAKEGKFKAEHKMAEWLGCNILDLYAVLTAMGHTLIHDPAAEKAAAVVDVVDAPVVEAVVAEVAVEVAPQAAEEKKEDAKPARPELATFRLRRSRPAQVAKPREDRPERPTRNKEKTFSKSDKKPFDKKGGDKDFKKNKDGGRPKRDDKGRDDREDRVYTSNPAKFEDSPFAILQQLKMKE